MKNKLLLWMAIFAVCPATAQAQTWSTKNGFPNNDAHNHPVAWAIDGIAYAATGATETKNATKDFYRYDPSTDTWTALNPFPGTKRGFSIGAVYQGKGYLGFGSNGNTYLNDLWRYDPQTQAWTQLASCPCAGRQHPAFVVNDVYGKIFAGLGNDTANMKDWWEYDIATNTWTQKSDFPSTARHHPFEFSMNGFTYVGLGDDHDSNYASQEFFKYDPSSDSWTQVASALDGIGRIAGAQFVYNGYFFVADGDGAGHKETDPSIFWRYDPGQDQWEVLNPHPGYSLWAPGYFVIDGVGYIIGGVDRSGHTNKYNYSMWTVNLDSLTQTGISTAENNNRAFQVFPNPVKNTLIIKQNNTNVKGRIATIYDLPGKAQIKRKLTSDAKQQIDVSILPSGIYFLQIKDASGSVFYYKFLKE